MDLNIVHFPTSLPAEKDAKTSEGVQESEQSEEELLHNAVLYFPLNDIKAHIVTHREALMGTSI